MGEETSSTYKGDGTDTATDAEDMYRIQLDAAINWDGSALKDPDGDGVSNTGYVQLIKFTPATTGNFEYVSTCSNRGICNGDDGLCECFKGFTGADCATLSPSRSKRHHRHHRHWRDLGIQLEFLSADLHQQ